MALALPVQANEPGPAALDFLKKVKAGEIDLTPGVDTALQPNTSDEKRATIRQWLEKMKDDLKAGKFEIGETKTDDSFAAVMVSKTGGLNSTDTQIFPIALVRRGAKWLPAPVLASFENAVTGYTVPIRERLSALEDWMLRERVVGLRKLLAESEDRTRQEIRESIVGEDLEGDDLVKISELFLEACQNRNQAAILGFLGGMADPLPTDWADRLKASQAAVAAKSATSPWRLLVSPDVLRIRVNEEKYKDGGMISIGCLDPTRLGAKGTLGKIEILNLEFTRDQSGLWRLDLPAVLRNNDADAINGDEELDVDLLDRFPKRLREADGILPSATVAEAEAVVMDGFKNGKLRDLLRHVDLDGRPKDARIATIAAAEMWWSVAGAGAACSPIRMGFREEGTLVVAVYQWFTPSDPDRFEARSLFFNKTEKGWLWAPGIVSPDEKKDHKKLSDWVRDNLPEWRLSWRAKLLAPSIRLEHVDLSKQATDDQVRELVERWLAALKESDLEKVLVNTAWLGGPDEIPMKSLRNISYDLAGAKSGEARLLKIYRSESWVAASISQEGKADAQHAFIPIITTPEGPRSLPEIDLIGGGNRTRTFLNEESFKRLALFTEKGKISELEGLFDQFQKEIKPG